MSCSPRAPLSSSFLPLLSSICVTHLPEESAIDHMMQVDEIDDRVGVATDAGGENDDLKELGQLVSSRQHTHTATRQTNMQT